MRKTDFRAENIAEHRRMIGFSSGSAAGSTERRLGKGGVGCGIRKSLSASAFGWVLVLSTVLSGIVGCQSPGHAPGEKLPPSSQRLFNGKDLSGFHTWLVDTRFGDPRGVFSVTNGLLRLSGDGLGYLATDREFANYRLRLEYRWGRTNTSWGDRVGRARDSGVFLHATGPDGNSHDGNGAFMAAIECNLFEGASGDFLLIRGDDDSGHLIAPRVDVTVREERDGDGWPWWDPDGELTTVDTWGRVNWRDKDARWKDAFGFRGRRDVERPVGQWNQLEIECRGHTISIWLNGRMVNRATNVYPERGRILLQCEGSEIFFRNMELHSLE